MDVEKVQVEKLRDASNWPQWQFVIRTLLDCNGALGVCDGSVIKPTAETPEDAGAIAALDKWLKADRVARKLFVTTVEAKPLQFLMNCETACEMWQKLHAVYDLKSDETLSLIQKQFFDFKWDVSLSVADHIAKLEQMANRMKKLGGTIPDSMLLTRILSILPKEFKHFHSAWDSTDGIQRTLENLTTRLLTEEQRLEKAEGVDKTVALFSKFKVGEKPKQHQYVSRKAPGCFTCGKKDHFRRDCPGCVSCGSKNHVAKNCSKSKKGDKPQSGPTAFVGNKSIQPAVEGEWIIDSGASDHMANDKSVFQTFEVFEESLVIKVGNGAEISAVGKGTIAIETLVDDKWLSGVMHNVLYTPGMVCNLFSVKQSAKKGINFTITNNGRDCIFEKGGQLVATGTECGNLYKINLRVILTDKPVCIVASKQNMLQLWHERLAHQNKRHVKNFLKDLGVNVEVDSEFCDGCVYGKMHRESFGNCITRANKPRELIHSDVCGPMETESFGKKRYYVVFKDDFSGFRSMYFLREKSEVKDKFEIFCNEVRNSFGENIKELNSDGGKEYDNKEMKSLTGKLGIKHTITPPYTPEHNGVAERENRTIVEAARSMLYAKSYLPKALWAEAVNTAIYILNRTGSTKTPGKTPYELWFDKKLDPRIMEKFRVFGTECFVHVPKEHRKKWDKKALKGYFVGYHDGIGGYRVYVPEKHDVVVSRDVLFKEETLFRATEQILCEVQNMSTEIKPVGVSNNPQSSLELSEISDESQENNDDSESDYFYPEMFEESDEEFYANVPQQEAVQPMKLRNRGQLTRPERYGYLSLISGDTSEPESFKEAVTSRDAENWKLAMQDEITSLHENKTWVLVEKPKDAKIISNKWVYKLKPKADGSGYRYKARLVIRGFLQQEGIDYKETFSPVVRYETIRALLSVAARDRLHIRQFDIKTAFLYGYLEKDTDIYMQQPKGFEDTTSRVCKLVKSLYGLKQAPRCWNQRFTDFLSSFGLVECAFDPCLHVHVQGEQKLFVVIYVDDGLVFATREIDVDNFMIKLEQEFKAVITKTVKLFLGIELFFQNDGSIFLNQSAYVDKILKRFNMQDCKPVSTPIDTGWNKCDNLYECAENVPYREAVGSLMYLQIITRPDISFAVNIVARNLASPTQAHWNLVKRIFRYIKGTKTLGLLYRTSGNFEVFSDADYAGDVQTRKSTSGILCKFGGAAIIWKTRRQQCVSLSTTEAEFVSAASAAKEGVWLSRVLSELGVSCDVFNLNIDNQSAIKIIKNPEFHDRSKHIDVKYNYVRDLYKKGRINVIYVPTNVQSADIFTKPLCRQKFEDMRDMLGICNK